MKNKDLSKNSFKIIKNNANLQKNDAKKPQFVQNNKTIKQDDEEYLMLSEAQKFKFTLNYVIKLLKANMITVDEALDLLMDKI